MIKKLLQAVTILLALNFLAAAGIVGWLFQSHHLDKERASAIREIIFPATEPTTQPVSETQPAETRPSEFDNLEKLLRNKAQPAGEQVEAIQRSIDAQSAELDRRRRELDAMSEELAREKKRLADAGSALEQTRRQLDQRETQAAARASDQGYQNSLKLYSSMPATQVKKIFAELPDDAVIAYLQAMPPRASTKIIKEFKTKAELEQIHRIMEAMRLGKSDGPGGTKTEAKGAGQPKEETGVIGPSPGSQSAPGPAASTDTGLPSPGAQP